MSGKATTTFGFTWDGPDKHYHGECVICGEQFEDINSLVLLDGAKRLGVVCPRCLEAGKEGAIRRARRHAEIYKHANFFEEEFCASLAAIPDEDWRLVEAVYLGELKLVTDNSL